MNQNPESDNNTPPKKVRVWVAPLCAVVFILFIAVFIRVAFGWAADVSRQREAAAQTITWLEPQAAEATAFHN